MEKKCNTCMVQLDASAFSPDKRASDGLQGKCKNCCSLARRAAYESDPERFRRRQNEYYHANKSAVLAINKRSRDKNADRVREAKKAHYEKVKGSPEFIKQREAYAARTKAEKRAYDRLYRKMNADRLKVVHDKWIAENKALIKAVKMSYKARRRAQEKAGDSSRDIKNWISNQRLVCRWCNVDCSERFHVDHVQPLAKGGAHAISNLCIACPPCNLKKNARDPAEFEAMMRAERDAVERDRASVGMLEAA